MNKNLSPQSPNLGPTTVLRTSGVYHPMAAKTKEEQERADKRKGGVSACVLILINEMMKADRRFAIK